MTDMKIMELCLNFFIRNQGVLAEYYWKFSYKAKLLIIFRIVAQRHNGFKTK